ncbi:MAG: L,D-transpeptidase [Oligoflexia bacterium]|nr:L,D-transpeptidase [Oligoflexia bacterium]
MNTLRTAWAMFFVLALGACAPHPGIAPAKSALMKDGVIVIARSVPPVSEVAPESVLAFLPVSAAHTGVWLSIQSATGNIALMDGETMINAMQGEGIQKIKPTTYHLLHKQRNALWYAPDSYFEQRHLAVPAKGDRQRFRRGALGDFVLYIDKDTPIHSGPIWLDEIGGVRMSEEDLSRIYYRLPVGAPIEVK